MTIQSSPQSHYSSGPFRLDLQLGIVRKGEASVRFSPIELKVLAQLVTHPGELVSRAHLFDLVWPNQQVSDDVLTRAISDIRTSLAKLDDGKYIETLPRRGYRWAVPVVEVKAVEAKAVESTATENFSPVSLVEASVAVVKQSPRTNRLFLAMAFVLLAWLMATGVMWLTGYVFMPTKISLAVLPAQPVSSSANPMAKQLDEDLLVQLRRNQRITLLSKSAVASRPANPFPYFYNEFGARWVLEAQVEDYQGGNNIELTLVDARTGIEVRNLRFEAATSAELATQLARKLELDLLAGLVP